MASPIRRTAVRQPALEVLEARLAMATSVLVGPALNAPRPDYAELFAPVGYDRASATVTVRGTIFSDTAAVNRTVTGIRTTVDVTLNGTTRSFIQSTLTSGVVQPVKKVVFLGDAGNDRFTNNSAITAELYGGAGSDILEGGAGEATLYGDAGDDKLTVSGTVGIAYGGAGNDVLTGRSGFNYLFGDGDDDVLVGGPLRDVLRGGSGNDVLVGNGGYDDLYGEDGHDDLYGGADPDYLFGGPGVDYLDAGGDVDDRAYAGDEATPGFVPYSGVVSVVTQNDRFSTQAVQSVLSAPALDLNLVWNAVGPDGLTTRQAVEATLLAQIGEARYEGQNLYDVVLNLQRQGGIEVKSDGEGNLALRLSLKDNYFEATSTVPDLGSYADPRLSVRFDLSLTLTVASGGVLRGFSAPVPEVVVTEIDSHNAVGDFALAAANFFVDDLKGRVNRELAKFLATDKRVQSVLDGAVSAAAGVTGLVPPGLSPTVTFDPVAGAVLLRAPRLFAPRQVTAGTIESVTVGDGLYSGPRFDLASSPPAATTVAVTSSSAALVSASDPVADAVFAQAARSSLLDTVALNPQPLPPKVINLGALRYRGF